MWDWGWNEYGQVGAGTHANRNVPVRVKELVGAEAMGGGGVYTLALKEGEQMYTSRFRCLSK